MDRLPATPPPPECRLPASSPTDPPVQPRADPFGAGAPAWHDLLVETWAKCSAQLDLIDASLGRDSQLKPGRLDTEFHGCQILLCQALRDGRLADRGLVWDRGATLFRAGLQRQASTPLRDAASLLSSKRAWLRELRALMDLVLREGDPRRPPPRPAGPTATSLDDALPDNFVGAVRERTAHLAALTRGRPAQSLDQPGHPQLVRALEVLKALGPEKVEVFDPDALPRWQAALREAIALEDEALAIAGAADTRPSIAVRQLRHCRAPQSKGPPGGGP